MTTTVSELTDAELVARFNQLQKRRADKYWSDPYGWIRDHVTIDLAPYQQQELALVGTARRVAARGPRGSGKTTPAALLFWWFACTRELAGVDWKIPTTAGVWRQLTMFLWPEIHKWVRYIDWDKVGLEPPSLTFELQKRELKWRYGSGFAAASTNPAFIEGAHADGVMVIVDEAKSVKDGVFDAIEGFFSTPGDHYVFVISTPGAATGRFHDICTGQAGYEDWSSIHVTIDDAITAGRITEQWRADRERQWGVESQPYQCHVLANFAGDPDGVIPMAWIEAAVERGYEYTPPELPHLAGVDVADTGEDQTVMAYSTAQGCYKVERLNATDVVNIADLVHTRVGATTQIQIDSIGVGAGTLAAAQKLGLRATGFVASKGTKRRDLTGMFGFTNLRAAAWWNLRELLDPANGHNMVLPDDPMVLGDLSAPKWREVAGGKITIESKDDIRKRLGRSTDHGDAIVMALWHDDTAMATGWADNVAQ